MNGLSPSSLTTPIPGRGPQRSISQLPLTEYADDSTGHDVSTKSVEAGDSQELDRGQWGGALEFILTCVGTAVGLGNVWRFPYLCYKNGGGAFLVPYVIMLCLVGVPLFFLELAFGQFASMSPIKIWTISPIFKGLGWSMVLASLSVAIYYNVIIVWCIYYMFASMTSELPWVGCDHDWNTPACFDEASNMTSNFTGIQKTPAEEYFYNEVLSISGGIDEPGSIKWSLAACLAMAWFVVFIVLIKGIQSLGKVVYFTSTIPYILLTIMLIRGVTLPGALDGIIFYIKPDFSKLMEARVWCDAAVQIFYSLSTCIGALIAMASYNKFNNNCLRDALLVPVINCGTSVFAGFVIFSVLGFMAHQKGVDVSEVAESGPGLVFVVYPEALQHMPVAPLWSVLFFTMMTMLGFSSEFSMAECFLASVGDEYPSLVRTPRRNTIYRIVCCAIFFCICLSMVNNGGFYVTNLLDNYVGGVPLLFIGLMEVMVLMYVYGYDRFANDVYLMLGRKPMLYMKVCLCFVSPVILLAIIIFTAIQHKSLELFEDYVYPEWADVMGWLLCSAVLIWTPLWAICWCLYHGTWKICVKESQPTAEWGPGNQKTSSAASTNFVYDGSYDGTAMETVYTVSGLRLPRVSAEKYPLPDQTTPEAVTSALDAVINSQMNDSDSAIN